MHSTKIALLLAAAVLIIGLIGCGGSDVVQSSAINTTSTPTTSNPQVTSTAPAQSVDTQGEVNTAYAFLGDMDGDGSPSSGDAIKIMRIIAGLDAYTSVADVNQNGYADAGDAIKVLRCVLGLDYWPIVPGPPPPPF